MAGESISVLASSGDYYLNLSRPAAYRLQETLSGFLDETECGLVALIERSGAILTSAIDSDSPAGREIVLESLGVLAAGMYGSLGVLSQQMGERTEPEVFCHGEQAHLFVSPVSAEFFLVAVFDPSVTVGLVRMHAKRAAEAMMKELTEVVQNRTPIGPPASPAAWTPDDTGPFFQYK